VLTLHLDCLIKRTVKGREYLGLLVSKKKSPNRAEEDHVVWLTPYQAATVVAAVAEIRTITQPARERAIELENKPGRIPLPGVNWSDELTAQGAAELIGFSDHKVINKIPRERLPRRRVGRRFLFRVADVEAYLLSRVKDSWTLRRADGTDQMLSESLFVVFKNFFCTLREGKGGRRVIYHLVEPLTQQQVRAFLTGVHLKDGSISQRSAFDRFDIRDPKTGEVLRMNAHQCRHWITHNTARGGMPIREIARWQGRENEDAIYDYIHMNSTERIAWARHKIESGELQGPFVDFYFSLADDVKDFFLEGRLAAIHVTHMGLCLHDFTLWPCPKKLACLSGQGCPDYVFDPSDPKQRINLVQLSRRTSTALEQAEAKAKSAGLHYAQSWVEDARNTRDNIERILSSAPVESTSLVRPFAGQPTKFEPIGRS
jgi:excisionase family DNA binding protein